MEVRNEETIFLSFFEQADEVKDIVTSVIEGAPDASVKASKFQSILNYYQEQPELLDPHLESIISPLAQALLQAAKKNDASLDTSVKNFCSLLQCLTKVRGHKSVIKFYPVEVACLLPILNLLQRLQDCKGDGAWETQCQLMLWLSSLSLIPFNLHTLDDEDQNHSVVHRIQDLGKRFLRESGTVREFACLMLYRLLTRADMENELMSFMEIALQTLKKIDEEDDAFQVIGSAQAASFIFKHGERATLLELAHSFWKTTYSMMHSKPIENSLLLRKLGVKLVQRLALTLLEPITPKWRYILTTVNVTAPETSQHCSDNNDTDEEDDYDIPEEIEEVIEVLLAGVADKDTNVRWSSAKGIGRVCSRLPKSLADEVLSYIYDLFSDASNDSSWHGACLSIAELARRGLLLPEAIPKLVPYLERALLYDINRGAYSIGAHVRDSACYVCWACARSFDAEIMAPVMPALAPVLMTTACLDREVNCRRAAAAAYQECVGRVGNVPNGLDILQIADYFTLSKRSQAYLAVGPSVARHPAYGFAFVAHLLFEKVGHWDESLRELTADALACLAVIDLEYFSCDVLDNLLAWSTDNNLDLRHGACLCLASVLEALIKEDVEIPPERLTAIANIVMKIEKARLYRGKGGSIMRQAASRIIDSIAATHLTRSEKHRLRLLATINENIGHPKQEVTPYAIKALYSLSREFKSEEIGEAMKAMTQFYLSQLSSENVAFRRGYTLALGQLPKFLVDPASSECIECLSKATRIEEVESERDAQSRANAVRSLTDVFCELYSKQSNFSTIQDTYKKVMETMFVAMEDYSLDRRGDVGSWIREAAMDGLTRLLMLFTESNPSQDELTFRTTCYLLRNSVERISHIRQVAITHLLNLVEQDVLTIPHKDELIKIKEVDDDDDVMSAFGRTKGVEAMVSFLSYKEYQAPLLEGFIASLGGLEKTLSDAIADSLVAHLVKIDSDQQLNDFFETVLDVCTKHHKSKRLAAPALFTVNVLLKEDSLLEKIKDGIFQKIAKLVKSSLLSTTDFGRMTTGASILSCLAFQSSQRDLAWKELLVLLGHKYPFVRKQTAETIYERVLFQEETAEVSALSQLLLETAWDGSIEEVIEKRGELSRILNVEVPVRTDKSKRKDGVARVTVRDENASYKSLVDDFARGI